MLKSTASDCHEKAAPSKDQLEGGRQPYRSQNHRYVICWLLKSVLLFFFYYLSTEGGIFLCKTHQYARIASAAKEVE